MNKYFSYKAALLLISWPSNDSHPLSQESPAMTSLFHFTTVALKAEQLLTLQIEYRGASKSLAQPTSRCILFDSGNISFDASLVTYI
jgi:hypothetical protein